ncbi:MAG TPA: hypothetical protein VJ579_03395 [Candidatus Paceibacterota bacterium]|nr:hypothetical protein [Candidatus Paceibacterota bacterium]
MESDVPTPHRDETQLTLMEQKIDFLVEEARRSARARRLTFWITIIVFILPLIGIIVLLPTVLGSLSGVNTLGI